MYSVISLPDLMMFSRYNLVLGIPDHLFMLGSAVAQNIVLQWQWMPQVVILANLCPKGKEATMYALLAGSHNLGNTIGSNCGALLLEWLNVTPSGAIGESDKFANLSDSPIAPLGVTFNHSRRRAPQLDPMVLPRL